MLTEALRLTVSSASGCSTAAAAAVAAVIVVVKVLGGLVSSYSDLMKLLVLPPYV